jgi:hypothetical protein
MTTGGQVRALTVVAGAAALMLMAPASAQASPGVPDKTGVRDKAVALAGSNHYLAYAEYQVSASGRPDYADGALHVLAAGGLDRDLGRELGDAAPRTAAPYKFSIVGPMLTGYSAGDANHVRWWNVTAGTSGIGTLPTGARWQGSAPDGWVVIEGDNTTLAVQSTVGDVILRPAAPRRSPTPRRHRRDQRA